MSCLASWRCGCLTDGPASAPLSQSCTVGCSGCTFAARHDWADALCGETVSGDKPQGQSVERIDRLLTAPIVGTLALASVMLLVFFSIFSLADVPMSLIEEGFGTISGWVDAVIPVTRLSLLAVGPLGHRGLTVRVRARVQRR